MDEFRLNFPDAMQKLEAMRREREALEASYQDLMSDMARMAEDARSAPVQPTVPRDLADLTGRLANYVELEREQSHRLFQLLADAYTRLNEAYEE